ncbi:MAG: hemerythrin domain-containing protein [Burkholderiales bacterium]|nr:hemerythrin domain-containing protein [Burkholderiales bacterium]MDE2397126.1 hemerythrin domain-containing protein [Burkholderiales bacterium]
MARTDRFRQQHNDLLKAAGDLQALLNAAELSKDGSKARTCLASLMGKLVLHLTSEDQVLYPELTASKDAAVAALARRFSTEMQSTTKAVVAYNEKWGTASAIKANAPAFIDETKNVLRILADRIKRENQELYAAADKIDGKAFA